MPTSQVVMPPTPFVIDNQIDVRSPIGAWLIQVQNLLPLRKIDTSGGSYNEDVPPAGNNGTSGLSNQDVEIIYKKISSDGNTFTLNASTIFPEGPLTLTTQYAHFRIKSDGTTWWVSG